MLVRVGRFIGRGGSGYVASPSIQLSGLTIAEDAAGGTVLGDLSVANSPPGVSWTYAFKAGSNAAGLWQIINGNQVALADEASLDYEDTSSYPNEFIEATSDEMTPTVIERAFTISVTNVIEAPVNVTPPALTGSVEVGSTLSCSTGTWTDMGAGSFAYQWKDAADDSNIDGETASTLVLTHALIDVSVYCIVTATNAADSTAQNSNTVGPVVDTTAPVLSSASAAGTGLTTASAEVSTNEANGTLYVVVTTSATQPTAAQIKLGDDHADADAAFADSAAVSATGAQTPFSVTGLTHTTDYWAHFIHEDAEGNQSEVVTAAFETDAATVPDAFEVGDWSIAAGDEEADVTISSLPADGGDTITDIEYRVDGGSPVSSGTNDTTGFTIPSLTNDVEVDVEIRALNSVGAGDWSDVKNVTPEAPITHVTDDFNRADGSLGANWTTYNGAPAISGNKYAGGSGNNGAYRADGGFADDQYSEAALGETPPGTGRYYGVGVRLGATQGYMWWYETAFSGKVDLWKSNGSGGWTAVGTATTGVGSLTAAAVLRAEVEGSTHRLYINDVLAATRTDSSFLTGGAPGLDCTNTASLDNFAGGDFPPP